MQMGAASPPLCANVLWLEGGGGALAAAVKVMCQQECSQPFRWYSSALVRARQEKGVRKGEREKWLGSAHPRSG